jgi:hypothetical protein
MESVIGASSIEHHNVAELISDAYLCNITKRLIGHQTHSMEQFIFQMGDFIKFVGDRDLMFPTRIFDYKQYETYGFQVTPFSIESLDELLTLLKCFFDDYLMSFQAEVYFNLAEKKPSPDGDKLTVGKPDILHVHKVGIFDLLMRKELLKDVADYYEIFDANQGELKNVTCSFCNIVEFTLKFGFVQPDGLESIESK